MDAEVQNPEIADPSDTCATRKRRCLIAFLAIIGILGGYWFGVELRHEKMRPKLEQVRQGMTLEKIVQVVGYPPGFYSEDGSHFFCNYSPDEFWEFDDGDLWVYFGDDKKVVKVIVMDHQRLNRSLE